MTFNTEDHIQRTQEGTSKESSFSPSPLEGTDDPQAQTLKQPPPAFDEAGSNATPVHLAAADDGMAAQCDASVNNESGALPGTSIPTQSNVVQTPQLVDDALFARANGVSPNHADPFASSTSLPEAKSTLKPPSPVSQPELEPPSKICHVSNDKHERPVSATQEHVNVSLPRPRLPQDRLGLLSDRIKHDPRGDTEAWLALIEEHKSHGRFKDARETYESFLKVFPLAAEQWKAYVDMELDNNEFQKAETIFARTVQEVPSLTICKAYLDYVRRRHSTANEAGRNVVSAAFMLVLGIVGKDKEAGLLWQDYLSFLRAGPGSVTGTTWQDQQKKDIVRAAFYEAVSIPHDCTRSLWTEYNKFEREVDKTKLQQMLRVKSSDYTQAQTVREKLDILCRDVDTSTVPRLPPAYGFAGHEEYTKQVDAWNRWINYEKTDPMFFKRDQPGEWRARVLFAYRQATVPLFFWPEIWFSAAAFCLFQGLNAEADKFLARGTAANPESCLLAFQKAERIEANSEDDGTDGGRQQRGDTVRKPYDDNLNALYDLILEIKEREKDTIVRIKAEHDKQQENLSEAGLGQPRMKEENEDDDEDATGDKIASPGNPSSEAQLSLHIQAVERSTSVQVDTLKKIITFVWTALMRAMRRVQGKGTPSGTVRGVRGIFADARKRGQLTSEFYTANALIEHNCFEESVGTKIFERGWKLFPDDAEYAVSYIKHLLEIRDVTNARATFEIMVSPSRLGKTPELFATAKPLFALWHNYESHYGDLPQLKKLEQRMREKFPEDPDLTLFSSRYAMPGFDPCAIRPIISPRAQATPKPTSVVEPSRGASLANSPMPKPLPALSGTTNSPKRPFDESDSESGPPRKLLRGESPSLKGAAGRRLDAAKNRSMGRIEHTQANGNTQQGGSTRKHPIPQPIYKFLHSLPPAHAARHLNRIQDDTLLQLLRASDLSKENIDRVIADHPDGFLKMPQSALMPPAQPLAAQPTYGQSATYSQPTYGQYANNVAYGNAGAFGYGQPGNQPYGYGR